MVIPMPYPRLNGGNETLHVWGPLSQDRCKLKWPSKDGTYVFAPFDVVSLQLWITQHILKGTNGAPHAEFEAQWPQNACTYMGTTYVMIYANFEKIYCGQPAVGCWQSKRKLSAWTRSRKPVANKGHMEHIHEELHGTAGSRRAAANAGWMMMMMGSVLIFEKARQRAAIMERGRSLKDEGQTEYCN